MRRRLAEEFSYRFRIAHLWFGRPRRRVPIVRQMAVTDCGPAALAMVLGFHGKTVALDEIRNAIGIGRGGTSAATLLRVARRYGMQGRGVRLDIDDLAELPPASILFWEFRHFVVFERASVNELAIVDPASGRRAVPVEKFRKAFTGVALIFEPTEAFERTAQEPKRLTGLYKQVLEARGLLGRIFTTSILTQLLSLSMPLFTGLIIDRVVPRQNYSLLLVLAVGYCIFQLSNVIAGFVRSHLLIHLRTQLEVRFTLRFLHHLIDLPYSYFQQHTSGDLMMRLGSNNNVRDILTTTTLSAFLDGSMASLYLVLLLVTSVPLTVMVILLATARLALLVQFRARQRQLLADSLENQAKSQTSQVEMLSGMETLKAMGLEDRAAEMFSNVFIEGVNISIRRGRLDAMFNAMLSALGMVSAFCLMFCGTYLVLRGTFTLGTMMAFTALAGGFLSPLNNLVSSALQLQMLEVYLERLNDVIDTATEQDNAAVTLAGSLSGTVALEEVLFRYSPQDPVVVDAVSLSVSSGSRVALVGRTGSGKSTLARLLAGLYQPSAGRILYDGKDLSMLDRRSVRSQLGIVTQDTQLFSGSIRRNISLSDPHMSLHRVIHAAKLACIHDDIIAMPLGYETPLADRGLSLSGGQRQRLAIARALASRPAILILDEATSHLDAVTEHRLNENLASLRCTRIVIAHRLSTIRNADLIVVMDGGKIVESGSHDVLLSSGGTYAALLRIQREPVTQADRPFSTTVG